MRTKTHHFVPITHAHGIDSNREVCSTHRPLAAPIGIARIRQMIRELPYLANSLLNFVSVYSVHAIERALARPRVCGQEHKIVPPKGSFSYLSLHSLISIPILPTGLKKRATSFSKAFGFKHSMFGASSGADSMQQSRAFITRLRDAGFFS